jgi:hypothetical protein
MPDGQTPCTTSAASASASAFTATFRRKPCDLTQLSTSHRLLKLLEHNSSFLSTSTPSKATSLRYNHSHTVLSTLPAPLLASPPCPSRDRPPRPHFSKRTRPNPPTGLRDPPLPLIPRPPPPLRHPTVPHVHALPSRPFGAVAAVLRPYTLSRPSSLSCSSRRWHSSRGMYPPLEDATSSPCAGYWGIVPSVPRRSGEECGGLCALEE